MKTRQDDGAFCVLTSGTTSLAKIVVCRHAALTCASSYFADDLREGETNRVGLFWIYYYMLPAISLGATVFVLPNSVFLDPAALVECARRQKLTGLYVTPSIIDACLQAVTEPTLAKGFAALRILWLTGEQACKFRTSTSEFGS